MKKVVFCALLLLAAGCANIQVETAGNVKRLVYRADAPEALTQNNQLTPYGRAKMQEMADKSCLSGYEMVREYRTIAPPAGSSTVWEIRCFEEQKP